MEATKKRCPYCHKIVADDAETCCGRSVKPRNYGSIDYAALERQYGTPEEMARQAAGRRAVVRLVARNGPACGSDAKTREQLKPQSRSQDRQGRSAARGFECMTVRGAAEKYDVTAGTCETTGRRALEGNKIQDYEVVGGKLWVLDLRIGHLAHKTKTEHVGDKKRVITGERR